MNTAHILSDGWVCHIISVAIDAPQDVINALSGKIGRLDGITAKTVYSNVGMA